MGALCLAAGCDTAEEASEDDSSEERRAPFGWALTLAEFAGSYGDHGVANIDILERFGSCDAARFEASSSSSSFTVTGEIIGMWEYEENGCTHQTIYADYNFGPDTTELQDLGVQLPASLPNTTVRDVRIFVESYSDFDCNDPSDNYRWSVASVKQSNAYNPQNSSQTSRYWNGADLDVTLTGCL